MENIDLNKEIDQDREIDHCNDSIFKDCFKSSINALTVLINGVVNMPESRHKFVIKEMHYADPESKASEETKKSIEDVLVEITTESGEKIICGVEMQHEDTGFEGLCIRIRHYSYNLFSRNKLTPGMDYNKAEAPNIIQIWLMKNNPKFFEGRTGYYFGLQTIDNTTGYYDPAFGGRDDHFINVDYFARAKDYVPKNDLEILMMYLVCGTFRETNEYVKLHNKPYLQEMFKNEKIFLDNPGSRGLYMTLDEYQKLIRLKESIIREKDAEITKSKDEIKTLKDTVKAKDAEIQKANDRADAGIREANDRADKAEARIAELEAQLAAKS